MSTVNIVNTKNESVGEIELNDDVFNREVKEYILHEVVRMQRAARRGGNACTKTRVEVSGGGRKPWKTERNWTSKGRYQIHLLCGVVVV